MEHDRRRRGPLRALLVVLTCLGLGSASLAAAHGGAASRPDPAAAVVAAARSHLGAGYAWGASGPTSFDCSGLTSAVWTQVGQVTRMPRTSAQQQAWAVPIPVEQALPGDLVFFGAPVTHVGLISGRDHGALTLVDASATRKGVVERRVWFTGTVRFGRVPRPGMPAVRPWQPAPAPTPTSSPTATPTAKPTTLVSPRDPALHGKAPLAGLPARPADSSATQRRFAALARAQVGSTSWTDTGLVTSLWRKAGGAAVPDSRAGLRQHTHRVPVGSAAVGDLVVYAAPADHVGVYVGGGLMVDASRSLGHVVLRPVWDAPGVQLVRWNG